MTVRAPIDGTVLQVNVREGEAVSPGSAQPPLQLADLSAMCVRAELDERDIAAVKVGQAVIVRATAFPGREFEGRVSSVAPLIEPGRLEPPGSRDQSDVDVVRVLVGLTGSGELTIGMKADVYFRSDKVAAP
jgi:HlyD family secretion protein